MQILDEVRREGRATIGQMVKITAASRSTLRDHLRTFVEKRHLVPYGNGKGSRYAQP